MSSENPTVLDALRTLLNVQGHATVAQVVKYTKRPYREVVDTLDRNRKLYELKGARIVSLNPLWARMQDARAKAFSEGRLYQITEIDYGSTKAIRVNNPALVEKLGEPYTSGGYGDSITTTEVLATVDNLEAVEAAGIQPWEAWEDSPYRYWQEGHEQGAK